MRRLFYGVIVLDSLRGRLPAAPRRSLRALRPPAFRKAVADGRLRSGSPETAFAFAEMQLAAFLDGIRAHDFEAILSLAADA